MQCWYSCQLGTLQRRKDPTDIIGTNISKQLTLLCNVSKTMKHCECHRNSKVRIRREVSRTQRTNQNSKNY